MATYSVPSGVMSFAQTLASGVADTVTFADNFGYLQVYNASTTNEIYARADGGVASGANGAQGSMVIPPNGYGILANGLTLWNQVDNVTIAGTSVIPQGGGAIPTATTSTTTGPNPGKPGFTSPYGATGQGRVTNPGATVSLISTGAISYVISAAG